MVEGKAGEKRKAEKEAKHPSPHDKQRRTLHEFSKFLDQAVHQTAHLYKRVRKSPFGALQRGGKAKLLDNRYASAGSRDGGGNRSSRSTQAGSVSLGSRGHVRKPP